MRFRIEDGVTLRFDDRLQGRCEYALSRLGDVIIRRRDGAPAYQLAVVVDDAAQGITSVVRGADLLESTAWQIGLAEALGLPRVSYAHLPLVVEPDGAKLAKSRRSLPVDLREPGIWLGRALQLLRQSPPDDLLAGPPRALLAWAVAHWRPETLHRTLTVYAPSN